MSLQKSIVLLYIHNMRVFDRLGSVDYDYLPIQAIRYVVSITKNLFTRRHVSFPASS